MLMVLAVGHCCIDDVYKVIKYPEEDSAVGSNTIQNRCLGQSWERGGNASNNATVLAELGAQTEFFGTMANDILLSFFQNDMNSCGIKCDKCPIIEGFKAPTSVVICAEETGSRTIVHHNGGLPELTLLQFQENLNLKDYDWIHFEGRNVPELKKILKYMQQYNEQNSTGIESSFGPRYLNQLIPVSIEIEKCRQIFTELLPLADVVFVGKEFAVLQGAKDCINAAEIISKILPKGVLLICAWGDQGASHCVTGSNCDIKKVDAVPPGHIVDSLGAGDSFVAAVIYALRKKFDIDTSVRFGCKIASMKLRIKGFKGIGNLAKDEPELK